MRNDLTGTSTAVVAGVPGFWATGTSTVYGAVRAVPVAESYGGAMSHRVAVVGGGSWGTAVAAIAACRVPTVLWARSPDVVRSVAVERANPRYLPGVVLPERLRATTDLGDAVGDATMVIMAVPSHGFRSVARQLVPYLGPGVPVVSLSKGLEQGTHARMTEILEAELPGRSVGVLSGPNLAREIAAGQPAATVVAMSESSVAEEVQLLLHTERFRIYTNPDVVGCEVAGFTKNVLALAAGMSIGLGLGDSSLAALVTRGLAEMGRLVVAMGGDPMTVASLAGVGDLVATCTSPYSRNRSVGVALGSGGDLGDIVGATSMVAEGVKSARPLVELAGSLQVEMPIGQQVAEVIEGRCTAAGSLGSLMTRAAKAEFVGLERPITGRGAGLAGSRASLDGTVSQR